MDIKDVYLHSSVILRKSDALHYQSFRYAIDEVDNGDDLEVLTARTWLAKQWPQRLVDIAALIYRDKATDQDIIDCVSECQGHLNTYKLRQWPSLDRAPRGNCPEIEQEVRSLLSDRYRPRFFMHSMRTHSETLRYLLGLGDF